MNQKTYTPTKKNNFRNVCAEFGNPNRKDYGPNSKLVREKITLPYSKLVLLEIFEHHHSPTELLMIVRMLLDYDGGERGEETVAEFVVVVAC
jgi:hypothetical protein